MIGSYEISARLGRLHLQGQHGQHGRRVRLQTGLGNNKPMQNASLTLKARLSVVFPGCLRVKMQRGVASLCDKTNLSSDSGSISIAAMMIYYCRKSTHKGSYRNRLTGQGFLDVVQGIFLRALAFTLPTTNSLHGIKKGRANLAIFCLAARASRYGDLAGLL